MCLAEELDLVSGFYLVKTKVVNLKEKTNEYMNFSFLLFEGLSSWFGSSAV